MSETSKYSVNANRRDLRCNRKVVQNTIYSVSFCHHCNKQYQTNEVIKCSSSLCGLYFWIPCYKKYKPMVKRRELKKLLDENNESCFVCKDLWVWSSCQSHAINEDLRKIGEFLNTNKSCNKRAKEVGNKIKHQNFKRRKEFEDNSEYVK